MKKVNEIPPVEIVKYVARKKFKNYAKFIDDKIVLSQFHKTYYEILDRFAHGKIKKLIVTVPPQTGKSEGSSRKLPSFLLGLNPSLKILIGSYAASLAEGFNKDVQRIMDTPEYKILFPDTRIMGEEKKTRYQAFARNSKMTETIGKGGYIISVGRNGSLTGKSVDIAILDDLYKDHMEANSPIIREAAWKWYTTVVTTRLHNNSQQLIVFTRWHKDDLIGRIEDKENVVNVEKWEDLDNIPEGAWVKINFPALKVGEPTRIAAF